MRDLSLKIGKVIAEIDVIEDYDVLWQVFTDFLKPLGANLFSYHHIPPDFASDSGRVRILSMGFSDEWVRIYREEQFHLVDPFIQRLIHSLVPFRWSEVREDGIKAEEQQRFVEVLDGWLKGDGLAIPAFGPSGRNGHFGVGHTESIDGWTADIERAIFWACQAFHHRFCILQLTGLKQDFRLTRRQTKILQAMAQGYNDSLICGLVGARLESVQSSITRIQKKMGVIDRPSAIIRGIACGIIRAPELKP